MKIGYLVNEYPKVTHTFVRTEIAALERVGVDVARVAIRPAAPVLLDAADRAEVPRTQVVLNLGVVGVGLAVLRTLAFHPARFVAAAALALRLGRRSQRGLFIHAAYLAEACVILQWAQAQAISHFHATFGSNPATVALLCRALGGPPFSFTAHGPEEFDDAIPLSIPEKIAQASFVVAVSEAGRRQLQQLCAPNDWPRLHVVRCGIDARFSETPPTPVPATHQIVYVGRLCREKAPLLLVDAMARLKAAGRPCELVMVGDGPLRAAVESRIRSEGLGDRVHLAGWANRGDVQRYVTSSRVLVLPSLAEGLPVAIMEALAMHRPVICTEVGAILELVEPGVCGWVIRPGSLEQLTAAIEAALDTPLAALERMGRNGAERVARWHDATTSAQTLAALFARSANGFGGH